MAIATAETEGWIKDSSFTSDSSSYTTITATDGRSAMLGTHEHQWVYTVSSDGRSLSAACSVCERSRGTVALSGQEEYTYNGSAQGPEAVVTGRWNPLPEINYVRRADGVSTPLEACPSDVGAYIASITITDADGPHTIQMNFVIEHKQLVKSDFDVTLPTGAVYDGVTDWLKDVGVTAKDPLDKDAFTWTYWKRVPNPKYPADSSADPYIYSWVPDGTATDAGTYVISVQVTPGGNYIGGDVPADWNDRWAFTVASVDYTYSVPQQSDIIVGGGLDSLPYPTGVGLTVNGSAEAVDGDLTWYIGEGADRRPATDADISELQIGTSLTLYWEFTATNENYTKEPKSGSASFTIVDAPLQDLRIMNPGSKENLTEISRKYGEPTFYLNVQNYSSGGGTVTYASIDNNVAKVEQTGGSYAITINGAGTVTITATAAAVPGKYKETTATCTLTVEQIPVFFFGVGAQQKVYDGTTDAEPRLENATIYGALDGDDVYVRDAVLEFVNANAGSSKMVYIRSVELGGADAGNYVVNYEGSSTTTMADITKKPIELISVDRVNKVYDGSYTYPVSGEVFSGLLPGVTLINGQDYFLSGVFPDADADETDQLVRVFVDFRNNEKTKNYQLSIPNGDYWFPSYARITKAAGGSLKTETETLTQAYANTGEHTYAPDWSGLPSGQTWTYSSAYSVSSGSTAALTTNRVSADGKLTYAIAGGKAGDTVTITLKAQCGNYEDFTTTLRVILVEKSDQAAVRVTGGTTVVYGQTLQLGFSGGSGTGKVSYTVVNGTGEATIDANGLLTPVKVGSVTVTATKEGDSDYNAAASAPVEITITKATPTGEPKYTEIKTGGKTLDDAALTLIGSTISLNNGETVSLADGKLEWIDEEGNVLSGSTRVEANKTYKWRFTPTNANYTVLEGETQLYSDSSSGDRYTRYTVQVTVSGNGTVSPSGWVRVREGLDQTFTITPDQGYAVAKVLVDGRSVGAVTSYTLRDVTEDHTIQVIFMKANGNPQTGVDANASERP